MAAIKPHLAQPDENTELENRYWRCVSEGTDGLGRAEHEEDHDVLCPSPVEVLDQTHAGLMQIVYTREIIIEQLRNAVITPGYKGGDIALFVDRPVTGPTWNPMLEVESTSLLSWTTKMGTPSFSLPAGAPQMGGACPGAIAGQSIVPDEDRRTQARRLLPVLHGPNWERERRRVTLANTVCEHCYAEGGQYATGSVQYHQLVRFTWARRAIRVDMRGEPAESPRETAFVETMIDAIDRVDFKSAAEPTKFRGRRYFRIHDSGDFFDTLYLMCWKAVADHYHPDNHKRPIVFWAPSRIWAEGAEKVEQLARINGDEDSNLVIRPSAYETNAHGPAIDDVPGWAAASTVYTDLLKADAHGDAFDWDCQAYAVEASKHSCREARGPADETGAELGTKGCRACWQYPHLRVNYTLHTR